jgi:hypothetical protein
MTPAEPRLPVRDHREFLVSRIGTMLPDSSVPLANKVAARSVTTAEDVIPFDIFDLTKIDMACLLRVLVSLELTIPDPIAPRHVTSQNEAVGVGVVVGFVELTHELPGLLQDLIISRRPDRSVHVRWQCRDSVREVSVTECHSVIVDARIEQDTSIPLFFAKGDEAFGLVSLSVSYRNHLW